MQTYTLVALALYLLVVNLYGGFLFYTDKRAAQNSLPRIPESRLHFLEALGSVFTILPLIYILRHKNRKPGYYLPTYLVLTAWLLIAAFGLLHFCRII